MWGVAIMGGDDSTREPLRGRPELHGKRASTPEPGPAAHFALLDKRSRWALFPNAPSPGAYETAVGSLSLGSGLEAVLPPWCSTTSPMMSSSVRVGVQPISACTLAMSGTRRNMSSKPSP
jgi:hypothetical protein